jgi:RNA polymerase sigma-70 factor (ECF subfamily)
MTLDDATFDEIVNAHYAALYRFAFSLAEREEEARDLTQESFAQFARKAAQIQERARVKTWLFTTLYRAFIDGCRRRSRHPEVAMTPFEEQLTAETSAPGEQLDAAAVLHALNRLPEVFRAPLILFYLEEHSYFEIAAILNVPPGTVMSRLSRGRKLLREQMTETPPAAKFVTPQLLLS